MKLGLVPSMSNLASMVRRVLADPHSSKEGLTFLLESNRNSESDSPAVSNQQITAPKVRRALPAVQRSVS